MFPRQATNIVLTRWIWSTRTHARWRERFYSPFIATHRNADDVPILSSVPREDHDPSAPRP
jgi:hypothetical protein